MFYSALNESNNFKIDNARLRQFIDIIIYFMSVCIFLFIKPAVGNMAQYQSGNRVMPHSSTFKLECFYLVGQIVPANTSKIILSNNRFGNTW